MILAHLSDLHLGHRAFDRWERGVNVRERDVAQAVQRAFEAVVERRPDLVIITGDVFDRPDPSPGALVTLTRGLEALHSALPDTPVVMVAGARDTPRRSSDAGALAALDAFPNVEAATAMPRSIVYEQRSLHVLLIPHAAVLRGPQPLLEPDPRMERNVLVTCGRVAHGDGPGLQVDPAEWDYVALGSHHSHRVVAPGVAYAGSLERVGPAPWREAGEEKGFVTVELPGAVIRFHPLPGRPVVALAPSRAPTGDPDRLRARLAEVVREIPGGVDRKVVRVQLRGPGPSDLVALQGLLPELDAHAVHLSVGVEDVGGKGPSSSDPLERARAALSADASPEAHALLERVLGDEGFRSGPAAASGDPETLEAEAPDEGVRDDGAGEAS